MSHEVITGDCRDVMRELDADSVDAIVTSPPYAMQRKKQYGGIEEKDYPQWAVDWMSQAHRVLKPEGSVIINIREHVRDGQISDYVHRTRLALRDWGWFEWDELIWHKKSSAPIGHRGRPRRSWERLLWFGKSRQGFCAPKANGNKSERVGRCPSSVGVRLGFINNATGDIKSGTARCTDVCHVSTSGGCGHPAAFPVSLAEWCIKLIAPESGVVLDPFSGSGTTGVASISNGRSFIGIELDPEYANIARERIAATQQGVA